MAAHLRGSRPVELAASGTAGSQSPARILNAVTHVPPGWSGRFTLGVVADEVRFAAGLFRGSAGFYDRCRLPYPQAMLADLVRRAGVSGRGRLLDLACGTGQLAFPLRGWFPAGVWAVDPEPDMVDVVRVKAAAAGAGEVRPVVSSAESLDADPGSFVMAVIGNAFHRLDRDLVARRVFGWLRPGGVLALCWSTSPWVREQDRQQALATVMRRWPGVRHRAAQDQAPRPGAVIGTSQVRQAARPQLVTARVACGGRAREADLAEVLVSRRESGS
jgi:ubiquinone/menaquinone biosynthesis C-methylase UbiE